MAQFDDIAQKRRDLQAQQSASAQHEGTIGAITNGNDDIIKTLLHGPNDPQEVTVTNDLADKGDIDQILSQLKNLHLTNLLEANKPKTSEQPMIHITDSAGYVGKSVGDLGDMLMKRFDEMSSQDTLVAELRKLGELISHLDSSRKGDTSSIMNTMKKVQSSVNAIDTKPEVHVAAPNVTVPETKVDLSPLQATLEHYFSEEDKEEKVDLDDFKAQDIDNTSPNMQYIGFVSPSGNWYIIENDVKGNKMRYLFGTSNYQDAFENASMHVYSLLNEAIHALTT